MAEIGWTGMRSNRLPVTSYQENSKSRPPFFMVRLFFFWFLVTGYWLLLTSPAHACPMCTELIEHGKDAFMSWKFGKGIAWSMLLMFAMPVSLVGGTAFYLAQTYRKAQHETPLNEHDSKP